MPTPDDDARSDDDRYASGLAGIVAADAVANDESQFPEVRDLAADLSDGMARRLGRMS